MKTEWMNNGEPFPAGHPRAGQLGRRIDFEDGVREPQNVYASDREAMIDKLSTMYGSTQTRISEVKSQKNTPTPTPTPAPQQQQQQQPEPIGKMTADERMQATADLQDPAKAPQAIARLLKDGVDVDLVGDRKKNKDEEIIAKRTAVTEQFLSENPEFVRTPRNGKLLRDAIFAKYGWNYTADQMAQEFHELLNMGALETLQQTPAIQTPPEPSAPPALRPRGSTGAPSHRLGGTSTTGAGGTPLTRADVDKLLGTDEYERRLAEEPGFQAKVDALYSNV